MVRLKRLVGLPYHMDGRMSRGPWIAAAALQKRTKERKNPGNQGPGTRYRQPPGADPLRVRSFPGINVASAADFAGEMGPIEHYLNAKSITGRAGLRPSRYQIIRVTMSIWPMARWCAPGAMLSRLFTGMLPSQALLAAKACFARQTSCLFRRVRQLYTLQNQGEGASGRFT